ncbi:MAG TPA: hypothetical protein VGN14_12645, partial [Candidatus Elarobacter sp.]
MQFSNTIAAVVLAGVLVGPQHAGDTDAFRLEVTSRGTKTEHSLTTITLTRTAAGVDVATTVPAQRGAGAIDPDGSVHLDGAVADAVEPYNELASALAARDGRGR